MLKKKCKYFPCHKKLKDCTFCYCPIYPCELIETRGKWFIKGKKKVWDCSDCVLLHNNPFAKLVMKLIRRIRCIMRVQKELMQ